MRVAVVIVIRREGRVLIGQRGPGARRSGYWQPPSGRVEDGESEAQAVVREAREELGVSVLPQACVWRTQTDDGRYALHWWLAQLLAGEPAADGFELSAVRWCTPAEFLALEPVFEAHRPFFVDIWPTLPAA
jgi:mutator protein MutT